MVGVFGRWDGVSETERTLQRVWGVCKTVMLLRHGALLSECCIVRKLERMVCLSKTNAIGVAQKFPLFRLGIHVILVLKRPKITEIYNDGYQTFPTCSNL